MKKIVLALVLILICMNVPVVYAQEAEVKVILDGKILEFDVKPVIIEGRTMVPMRVIFEELGMEVDWNSATQTITASNEIREIVLTIGSRDVYIDGRLWPPLDVTPQIINGRTMVPLRFIGESLWADVSWDGVAKTVSIASPKVIYYNDNIFDLDKESGIYIGQTKDGMRDGRGIMSWATMDESDTPIQYDGEWKDDKANGFGVYIFPGGSYSMGEWKDGANYGLTTIYKSNGDIEEIVYLYSGISYQTEDEWKKAILIDPDLLLINRTINYDNGDVYIGETSRAGELHGYGIYQWSSGDIYEGEWVNGHMDGYGVYKWPSGNIYEGEWKEGHRTGYGKLTWSSGKKYIGDWENSLFHGYGIILSKTGELLAEGEWKEGNLVVDYLRNPDISYQSEIQHPSSTSSNNQYNFWYDAFEVDKLREEYWQRIYEEEGINGYQDLDEDSKAAVDWWNNVIDDVFEDIFR